MCEAISSAQLLAAGLEGLIGRAHTCLGVDDEDDEVGVRQRHQRLLLRAARWRPQIDREGGGRGRIDENGRQLRRKLSVGLMVVVGRRKLSLSSTHAPTHPPTHAPAVEEEDLARAAQRRDELVHDPAGDVGELVLRALAPQRLGRGARGRAWQPPMLVCCDSGGGGEMVVVGRWRGRAG